MSAPKHLANILALPQAELQRGAEAPLVCALPPGPGGHRGGQDLHRAADGQVGAWRLWIAELWDRACVVATEVAKTFTGPADGLVCAQHAARVQRAGVHAVLLRV